MADEERIGGFLPPRAGEPAQPPAPAPSPARPDGAPRVGPTRAGVALMCGVLGLVVLPPVFSTAAIVLGRQAREQLEASGSRQGLGNARAAVALGWIGLAFFLVLLVLVLTGTVEFDGLTLQQA